MKTQKDMDYQTLVNRLGKHSNKLQYELFREYLIETYTYNGFAELQKKAFLEMFGVGSDWHNHYLTTGEIV